MLTLRDRLLCKANGVAEDECLAWRAGTLPPKHQLVVDEPPRLPPLTEDHISARRAACHACPRYKPEGDKCGLCGCGAIIAQRTASKFATCPDGRWPTLPNANTG